MTTPTEPRKPHRLGVRGLDPVKLEAAVDGLRVAAARMRDFRRYPQGFGHVSRDRDDSTD